MKFKYLLITIIVFSSWLDADTDSMIRVTAVGRSSTDISSISRARAAAFRAAKIEGYKKLAKAAGRNKDVSFFLKGARVVAQKYISDYEVEVVMEMPFNKTIVPSGQAKQNNQYRVEISNLEKEIKTISSQLSTLSRGLEELKKALKALEEKIREQNSQNE